MDMTLNPLVIVLAGLLTQALTWALARWGLGADSKLRGAIPALVVGLAVGVVAAFQVIQGADALTWKTLGEGLLAGAAAVLMHSQGREVGKALGGKKGGGPDALGKAGVVLLVLCLLPGLTSCSSSTPSSRHQFASALKASEVIAQGARATAIARESRVGCYAATISAAALATAGAGIAAWSDHGAPAKIPGVKVDYAPCASPEALAPMLEQAGGEVLRGYMAALLAASQILTGYLGGELECEERVVVLALVVYLDQAVGAVIEELVAPDGVVEVAEVVVDVGACGAQ